MGALKPVAHARWLHGDLKVEGFGRYEPPDDRSAELLEAADLLRERHVPPLFVCAYAEAWTAPRALAAYLSTYAPTPYVVTADVWFFDISPGRQGWSAHRGRADLLTRRSDAPPALVNTWVPLTDVGIDDACMHVLPLPDDPDYPFTMARHAEQLPPVALPVDAGLALAWDANVMHAGGPSHPTRGKRRVSLAFSVNAPAHLAGQGVDEADIASFEGRIDLIAKQILTYGPDALAPAEWMDWARGHLTLRRLAQLGLTSPHR